MEDIIKFIEDTILTFKHLESVFRLLKELEKEIDIKIMVSGNDHTLLIFDGYKLIWYLKFRYVESKQEKLTITKKGYNKSGFNLDDILEKKLTNAVSKVKSTYEGKLERGEISIPFPNMNLTRKEMVLFLEEYLNKQ